MNKNLPDFEEIEAATSKKFAKEIEEGIGAYEVNNDLYKGYSVIDNVYFYKVFIRTPACFDVFKYHKSSGLSTVHYLMDEDIETMEGMLK